MAMAVVVGDIKMLRRADIENRYDAMPPYAWQVWKIIGGSPLEIASHEFWSAVRIRQTQWRRVKIIARLALNTRRRIRRVGIAPILEQKHERERNYLAMELAILDAFRAMADKRHLELRKVLFGG
ncbi:MAG: hypothetical protein GY906_24170 [bacterium]|nr:hypothetical protein [bacterium]